MKVSKIKVNGITNPVGYVMDNVRVSWLVSETEALSIVETPHPCGRRFHV